MKIRNDLIEIKIGNKKYDFNNLILNNYLSRCAKSQLIEKPLNSIPYMLQLSYVLIKFDEPFDIQIDTELHNADFDICFVFGSKYNQSISEQQIIVEYNYETTENPAIWDYNKKTAVGVNLSDYYGRKITAIGFNSYWPDDSNLTNKFPVGAVLDTSNYNIYLQENQDLSITRRDIITTDALFYSNNKEKVSGPAHLAPIGLPQIIREPIFYNDDKTGWNDYNGLDRCSGKLYSIGLSSYTDYIDKEFVIGEDIEVEANENELNINGIENYLATDSPLFCNEGVFPNSNLYPIKSNYKYVVFKYKVMQIVHSGTYNNTTATETDTRILLLSSNTNR